MNRFYISEIIKSDNFTALNKARSDIEMYFSKSGYKKLNTYCNLIKSSSAEIQTVLEAVALLKTVKSSDCIYFQYPYYERHNKMRRILNLVKKVKRPKFIAIIHDIDALRYERDDKKVKKEINRLNTFDYIISHNESMTKWLRENGCNNFIVDLEVFDYLLDENICLRNERKVDIAFAGNLDKKKSNFIYKLIEDNNINYELNLYGPNFNGDIKNSNIKYNGCYSPEELIENLEGKFGLIWDGESLNECSGSMGNYTRYNNPHKLSMYIASGLPIICWSEMAIAKFVKENNIGICIDNLNDIESLIHNISDEEYKVMYENILKIRKDIINCNYIKGAVGKINREIELRGKNI